VKIVPYLHGKATMYISSNSAICGIMPSIKLILNKLINLAVIVTALGLSYSILWSFLVTFFQTESIFAKIINTIQKFAVGWMYFVVLSLFYLAILSLILLILRKLVSFVKKIKFKIF